MTRTAAMKRTRFPLQLSKQRLSMLIQLQRQTEHQQHLHSMMYLVLPLLMVTRLPPLRLLTLLVCLQRPNQRLHLESLLHRQLRQASTRLMKRWAKYLRQPLLHPPLHLNSHSTRLSMITSILELHLQQTITLSRLHRHLRPRMAQTDLRVYLLLPLLIV